MSKDTTNVFRIFLNLKKKELQEMFKDAWPFVIMMLLVIAFITLMLLMSEGMLVGHSIVWLLVLCYFIYNFISIIMISIWVCGIAFIIGYPCFRFCQWIWENIQLAKSISKTRKEMYKARGELE